MTPDELGNLIRIALIIAFFSYIAFQLGRIYGYEIDGEKRFHEGYEMGKRDARRERDSL